MSAWCFDYENTLLKSIFVIRDIKGENVVAIILRLLKKILYQIQSFEIDKKHCLLLLLSETRTVIILIQAGIQKK